MNVSDILARIEAIENAGGDFEAQHSLEDQLYEDVLRAIANGAENAQALAETALLSLRLDFPRYCA